MKFLVDANLPRALVGWLGADAVFVDDLLAASAPDLDIWTVAVRESRVLISKDADFTALAEQSGVGQFVWIRCGNLRLAPFRAWFDARREAMIQLLALGERVVELR